MEGANRDDSVGRLLATQLWGPEANCQRLCERARYSSTSLFLEWRMQEEKDPWAWWPDGLLEPMIRFRKALTQKIMWTSLKDKSSAQHLATYVYISTHTHIHTKCKFSSTLKYLVHQGNSLLTFMCVYL